MDHWFVEQTLHQCRVVIKLFILQQTKKQFVMLYRYMIFFRTISRFRYACEYCLHLMIVISSYQVFDRHKSLLAKIKVFGVLLAYWHLVLDAGTVLVSVPPFICAGFVYCHCTGRWTVLDNTHSKESNAFRWGLLYSHYHGPYFY